MEKTLYKIREHALKFEGLKYKHERVQEAKNKRSFQVWVQTLGMKTFLEVEYLIQMGDLSLTIYISQRRVTTNYHSVPKKIDPKDMLVYTETLNKFLSRDSLDFLIRLTSVLEQKYLTERREAMNTKKLEEMSKGTKINNPLDELDKTIADAKSNNREMTKFAITCWKGIKKETLSIHLMFVGHSVMFLNHGKNGLVSAEHVNSRLVKMMNGKNQEYYRMEE